MSLFSFYVLPYSAKSEGVLLPRGNWNLYKVYWSTDSKSPNLFEEYSKPIDAWQSSTILYNKSLHSIEDPFGLNKALNIPLQTQNILRRALDVSSKTTDNL